MNESYDASKLYFTIGEVAQIFNVNVSFIRYWDSQFDIIKPTKNKKGNRIFSREDIENFKIIFYLVKEKGMTLEGANTEILNNVERLRKRIDISERLKRIKEQLEEIKSYM